MLTAHLLRSLIKNIRVKWRERVSKIELLYSTGKKCGTVLHNTNNHSKLVVLIVVTFHM